MKDPGVPSRSSATDTPTPVSPAAPTWRVEVLGERDVAALRALKLEACSSHPTQFAYGPDDVLAASAGAICPGMDPEAVDRAIGVYCDGELQGMAEFVRAGGAKSRHLGEMKSVYVTPRLRGTGAAKALVGELVRYASRHVDLLCAAVGVDNVAARALYAGYGFTSYGVHPGMIRVDGRDVPGELLSLTIRRPEPSVPD